ncbi:MAG: hypothetical protein R6U22_02790, partial [Desulfohalobiaceae bacterium]
DFIFYQFISSFIMKDPEFKGYIHDVGGPTANFRHPACKKQLKHGSCQDRACLTPKPCPSLRADHSDYLSLLRKLRNLKGIRKVFIRSGIRHDYLLSDQDQTFFHELVTHHVSRQYYSLHPVMHLLISNNLFTVRDIPCLGFALYMLLTCTWMPLSRA